MTNAAETTLASAYRGVVCDLDGVVYRGPHAVPHAVAALTALEVPVQYATNNASREPAEVAEHLRHLGLRVAADDVATSSEAAAAAVGDRFGPGARVLACGGPGVAAALSVAGLTAVAPGQGTDVVAVVQGYGPRTTVADLGEAAYAVERGAYWVATNVDLTIPTDRGVAPGNGSLVRAVATAVGRSPDDIVGKPFPALYVLCSARLGVPPDALLAVGDRLDTDIEGAVTAGVDALLVLTGVDDPAAAVTAPTARRATFLATDLRALHAELPRPARIEGWWRCGADEGRLEEGRWVSRAVGSLDQRLTNRLHAAYAALDDGSLDSAAATRLMAEVG